jgi:hypothetical protein
VLSASIAKGKKMSFMEASRDLKIKAYLQIKRENI